MMESVELKLEREEVHDSEDWQNVFELLLNYSIRVLNQTLWIAVLYLW